MELSDPAGVRQYIFIAVHCTKTPHFDHVQWNTQAWPTACIYLCVNGRGANMALSKEGLIQELKHQIHSPLAAIRNALYLTAVRIDDPESLRYLALAEAEITRIAAVLKNADQIQENKQVHVLIRSMGKASAA